MSITRITISLTLAGVLLTVVPTAYGIAKIGRGTLNVSAKLNFEYDTNIFGNSSTSQDLSVIFTPGLNYSRRVGLISTTAALGVKSIAFDDTTGQDSLDPFFNVNFSMDRAEKGSVAAGFGYTKTTQANEFLLTRTESDEFRGNGRIDYFYSEKTGVRMNSTFRVSDFGSAGYGDVKSYALGGGFLYRYSQKLTFNATYDYSPESVTNSPVANSNPNSDNHRISVGVEGELRPKLNGSISVGQVRREFDVGGSSSSFLLASNISWAASQKTSWTLSASQNFDTTPGAESAKISAGTLSVSHSLTDKLSLSGRLGRQEMDFDQIPGPITRSDTANIYGADANYKLNDHYNANAAVTHRINNSTLQLADYTRTVYSLGLNASF